MALPSGAWIPGGRPAKRPRVECGIDITGSHDESAEVDVEGSDGVCDDAAAQLLAQQARGERRYGVPRVPVIPPPIYGVHPAMLSAHTASSPYNTLPLAMLAACGASNHSTASTAALASASSHAPHLLAWRTQLDDDRTRQVVTSLGQARRLLGAQWASERARATRAHNTS